MERERERERERGRERWGEKGKQPIWFVIEVKFS